MREIEIAGKVLSIRGLKRKEIKSLRKKGFEISALKIAQVDDLLDDVFPMIFNEQDVELIENSTYKEGTKIWTAILKETYGNKDEEKNLPTSGDGSQTEKE